MAPSASTEHAEIGDEAAVHGPANSIVLVAEFHIVNVMHQGCREERAPAAVPANVDHAVRHFLTFVVVVAVEPLAARCRILRGQAKGKRSAGREGDTEQRLAARRIVDADAGAEGVRAERRVEEGVDVAGRERDPLAGDLDIGLVQIGVGAVVIVGKVARADRHLVVDEGTDEAEIGLCARIQPNVAAGAGSPVVERVLNTRAIAFAGAPVEVAVDVMPFNANPAADSQAGFRPWDVVEARPESVADPHIFHRFNNRKVGGLRPGTCGQDCRGAEEKALEIHFRPPVQVA
jgi:hypothetical protein